MKSNRVGIGAILFASVVALATPLTAEAARGGFGGGGGHFGGGGGHFGGGGMHFGGGGSHFGGGGMHFGGGGMHFGGGGMHFGGGGMHFGGGGMHFGGGAPRFGGARIGGGHLGGLPVRGGGMHLGGSHPTGLSRNALNPGSRTLQNTRLGVNPKDVSRTAATVANPKDVSRAAATAANPKDVSRTAATAANAKDVSRTQAMAATRMTPALSKQAFAHHAFAHDGFRRVHFFRRFPIVFGFVGPLFWPFAYNDIYCDVFWGYWGYGCSDPYLSYGYGNPFWDYGYGDIYGGVFSPFGYNDLAGYLPGGQSGGRRTRSTPSAQIAQMCGDDTKEVAGWPIDRIRQLVSPNDQQGVALDDLADASVKAAQIIKTACPTSVAFTATGRLAAMQQRIEAMEQAVEVVRGPLDTFYGALTDEQKAKLNAANETTTQPNARSRGSLTQNCAATNAATQWPGPQIEKAVQPNEAQQARLNDLQSAAAQAAEQLAASCPSELPTTPPARLAAVAKRLDVMLTAVKSVRSALNDFYDTLNDEQKAQFNTIGRSRTAQRQG